MKIPKIRFVNIQKMANMQFLYSITPSYRTFWMGQIIHIGTKCYYFVLDYRGINSLEDFADALQHPKTWRILKKIKDKINQGKF